MFLIFQLQSFGLNKAKSVFLWTYTIFQGRPSPLAKENNMKLEQTLNLVPVKKPKHNNPIVQRRHRLVNNINKQIEAVRKFQLGEKVSRIWWWSNEEGEIFLPIKYGKNDLELAKGKYSIQCQNMNDVEKSLETVKLLASKGQLDELLTNISKDIRAKFGKD